MKEITATLLHEMVHMYNDTVLNIQDCSRGGTYHNKFFKEAAEARGLICRKSEKYGYSDTSSVISEQLFDWICENDLKDIKLWRNDLPESQPGQTGTGAAVTPGIGKGTIVHNYRYCCPKCGAIARSGKELHLICGDCLQLMVG